MLAGCMRRLSQLVSRCSVNQFVAPNGKARHRSIRYGVQLARAVTCGVCGVRCGDNAAAHEGPSASPLLLEHSRDFSSSTWPRQVADDGDAASRQPRGWLKNGNPPRARTNMPRAPYGKYGLAQASPASVLRAGL